MKNLLARVRGAIVAARHWIATARKAAAPVVAGVIALVSIPTLGIDPAVGKSIAAVAGALGIVVYALPNVAQEPRDHKDA